MKTPVTNIDDILFPGESRRLLDAQIAYVKRILDAIESIPKTPQQPASTPMGNVAKNGSVHAPQDCSGAQHSICAGGDSAGDPRNHGSGIIETVRTEGRDCSRVAAERDGRAIDAKTISRVGTPTASVLTLTNCDEITVDVFQINAGWWTAKNADHDHQCGQGATRQAAIDDLWWICERDMLARRDREWRQKVARTEIKGDVL